MEKETPNLAGRPLATHRTPDLCPCEGRKETLGSYARTRYTHLSTKQPTNSGTSVIGPGPGQLDPIPAGICGKRSYRWRSDNRVLDRSRQFLWWRGTAVSDLEP